MNINLNISRLAAALGIFLLVGLRYWESVFWLEKPAIVSGLCFAIAYFVYVSTVPPKADGAWVVRVLGGAAFSAIVAIGITTVFESIQWDISRLALLLELFVVVVLIALNYMRIVQHLSLAANYTVFAAGLLLNINSESWLLLSNSMSDVFSDEDSATSQYVFSSRYDLRITELPILDKTSVEQGGGISLVAAKTFLIGTGDGEFKVAQLSESDLKTTTMSWPSPINRAANLADASAPSTGFRVTDIYLDETNNEVRSLFASYLYWNSNDRCVTLRLSEAMVNVATWELTTDWMTRYESHPCLTMDELSTRHGGRIARYDEHGLLLSVGDFGFLNRMQGFGDLPETSYGKVHYLDITTWESHEFTKGHRNPQGLLVSQDEVWLTEHGPRGGDELNLLVKGVDYGWPESTYGTAYAQKVWPYWSDKGNHTFGQKPVYSFLPSIGISNLLKVQGDLFSAWKGDLIIGSLAGTGNGYSLYRAKIVDDRPILIERIKTQRHVRDLAELDDGKFILWDGISSVQVVEPATHVFSQCTGCHAVRWQSHGIGPDLMGVVGSQVGTQPNFQYSKAMREIGGRWSTERLDRFLRDPKSVIPGTSMEFNGLADAEMRAEIIQYLMQMNNENAGDMR